MKRYTVAIDVSPLSSGHKVRGVGVYTAHLQSSLLALKQEKFSFIFYTDKKEITKPVDLFHIPYFDPFFLQIPLAHLSKTIVTIHDLTPIVLSDLYPKGIKGSIKWQINKMLLQQVAGVVTPSECSKNDIAQITAVSDKKIFVTPLGVDSRFQMIVDDKKLASVRKKYNLPEKFVLYVGDVTPNKNLPRLVRAATEAKTPLVMVGKSLTETNFDRTNAMNQDRIYVQEYAKTHSDVLLTGYIPDEDMAFVYNLASCFVYPSLYEGFGLPVIEAMACGTPVITSSVSSLPEIAQGTAILIDPHDQQAIATALQSVMNDKKLRTSLIKSGHIRAKQFTWEHFAQEIVAVYEKIIHE